MCPGSSRAGKFDVAEGKGDRTQDRVKKPFLRETHTYTFIVKEGRPNEGS